METIVYLCGPIDKEDGKRNAYFSQLLDKLNDDKKFILLSPEVRPSDVKNTQLVFARDVIQVLVADIVVVDAMAKRGIGVGAEMLYAGLIGAKVITIAPKGGHYNRDFVNILGHNVKNWLHPFIEGISEEIIESNDINVLINTIKKVFNANNIELDNDIMQKMIFMNSDAFKAYFLDMLSNDSIMQKHILKSKKLKDRIDLIRTMLQNVAIR